jgi:hypothetical protein
LVPALAAIYISLFPLPVHDQRAPSSREKLFKWRYNSRSNRASVTDKKKLQNSNNSIFLDISYAVRLQSTSVLDWIILCPVDRPQNIRLCPNYMAVQPKRHYLFIITEVRTSNPIFRIQHCLPNLSTKPWECI